jgi:hypothetical protein
MAREVIALMLDIDTADVDDIEDDLAALRRSERLAATHARPQPSRNDVPSSCALRACRWARSAVSSEGPAS